jgi:hypothetical protein
LTIAVGRRENARRQSRKANGNVKPNEKRESVHRSVRASRKTRKAASFRLTAPIGVRVLFCARRARRISVMLNPQGRELRDLVSGALCELQDHLENSDLPQDAQWFTWSTSLPGLRDNLGNDSPPATRENRIHVNFWATVSRDGDVFAETAAHFRQIADVLLTAAAKAEQERETAEYYRPLRRTA